MKKALCKVIACLLLIVIPFSALAGTDYVSFDKNFSIRNGITYHMSRTDVEKAETAAGNKKTQNADEWETTVADRQCTLTYNFTNSQVDNLTYGFWGTGDDANSEDHDYLYNYLVKLYGNPISSNETYSPFIKHSKLIDYYNSFGTIKSLGSYNAWLTKYNDCYVVIELGYVKTSIYGLGISVAALNYWMVGHAELEAILNDNVNTYDSYAGDL